MPDYIVNADLYINVSTFVSADNEEEAKEKAVTAILNKEVEFGDPIENPKIKFVEEDVELCPRGKHVYIKQGGTSYCRKCGYVSEAA